VPARADAGRRLLSNVRESGMTDRITANLPSNDFDRTGAFYESLGFTVEFKGDDWMIISKGPLEIEFFPLAINPKESCFSACIRVDDLDGLYAEFSKGLPGCMPADIPRVTPPAMEHGLRMFLLIDPDGSLLRCIDNRLTGPRRRHVPG
jgi:hypothetical protein